MVDTKMGLQEFFLIFQNCTHSWKVSKLQEGTDHTDTYSSGDVLPIKNSVCEGSRLLFVACS